MLALASLCTSVYCALNGLGEGVGYAFGFGGFTLLLVVAGILYTANAKD